jgi:hypothetical protein
VFLSWGGRLVIIDLQSGELEAVSDRVAAVDWMPDGRAICFLSSPQGLHTAINGFFIHERGAQSSVRLADSASIAATGMRELPWLISAVMERSPSGKMLAIAAGMGDSSTVFIYNTDGSAPPDLAAPAIVINTGRQLPVRLDWSPDESQIAEVMVGDPRYSLRVVDLRTRGVKLVTAIGLPDDAIDIVAMLKMLSWSR